MKNTEKPFMVVHGGQTGNSKTLWHKDGQIYARGCSGHPEPVCPEVLERNGFTPSETLLILSGLNRRDDIDVVTIAESLADLSFWLSQGTGYICSEECPMPVEVLLEWKG